MDYLTALRNLLAKAEREKDKDRAEVLRELIKNQERSEN